MGRKRGTSSFVQKQ